MALFEHAHFIWSASVHPGRNVFVSFEKDFEWFTGSDCQLHLFADSRYRLFVNGSFIAYGPGRFVTQYPEYDSFWLKSHLKEGKNRVRVEVNFYGCSSFQTMPDGKPGFIAAGGSEDGTVDFATPGDWRARPHKAWDAQAPLFSFAQNPAEICDTRGLAEELDAADLPGPVRVLEDSEIAWPKPTPRSVPYPDYEPVFPDAVQLFAPLQEDRTYGFQTICPGFSQEEVRVKPLRRFGTWLHSRVEQVCKVGCFWSDLKLNGIELSVDTDTSLGNHGHAELRLREGWNLLTGEFEILAEAWSYMLRLPAQSEVSLHALPDPACSEVFVLSPVFSPGSPMAELTAATDGFEVPTDWSLDTGDPARVTPARIVAWDAPQAQAARCDQPYLRLPELCGHNSASVTWVFRFEREFYGHPVVTLEAPAGTIMDIAYDDWSRDDGCVNLYGSNPFTDAADRLILKGERQCVEVLNPRGGIYLQVTLRAPRDAAPGKLCLHECFVRRRTLLNEEALIGTFHSGRPEFDFAWESAVHTLCASTDEANSDCPWRERGSYIGDSVVAANLHHIVHHDLAVARRTFLNFGRAALPNGQLACCAPSWLRKPLEDFSYLWILGIEDLWSFSGDIGILRQNWKALQGIWQTPWETDGSGLWNANEDSRLFLDWGVIPEDCHGRGNAALNIFRFAALQATARMASVLGRQGEAASYAEEAAFVKDAIETRLWTESEGRFLPSLDGRGPALHANILALCYGLGDATRLYDALEPRLRGNFDHGIKHGQFHGHAELYFLYFVLAGLVRVKQFALAETLIAQHYGFLRSLGTRTLPEYFYSVQAKGGSCCHTWSSAGAIYCHRYILGLRQQAPGDPDRWILDPRATRRFEAVSGQLAHAKGPICVSWERGETGIEAQIETPEGVAVELAPGVVQSAASVG